MNARNALIFTAVLAACVGCDHATKHVAQAALAEVDAVSLASDTVRFELARNAGAFLSLGARLPAELRHTLLVVSIPLILAFACAVLIRSGTAGGGRLVGVALFAGGGLANWLDRLLHDGHVTDFVSVGVGPLRTGIFNLADVAILAGLAWVLLTRGARPERSSAA